MRLQIRCSIKWLFSRVTCIGEYCHDCGIKQSLVWRAPDCVWREISGKPDGSGVLCPQCFNRRAERAGILLMWRPEIEHRIGGDE